MNELALFAGAGGGLLGTRLLGWRVVCAVEIDPYCREVLLRRQEEGILSPFPLWGDVRTFDGKPWRGKVDVITGGFPCQPFSAAGKRLGEADERNLWPDTIRVIREVAPRFCLLENVPALLAHGYYGTILGELAESGYCRVPWDCIPAAALGANHRRDRLWIIADAQRNELRNEPGRRPGPGGADSPEPSGDGPQESLADSERPERRSGDPEGRGVARDNGISQGQEDAGGPGGGSSHVADTESQPERAGLRKSEKAGHRQRRSGDIGCALADATGERERQLPIRPGRSPKTAPDADGRSGGWWRTEPAVGRVAHGVAYRVDRLKALGNGQVPAVVRAAWELLSQEEIR